MSTTQHGKDGAAQGSEPVSRLDHIPGLELRPDIARFLADRDEITRFMDSCRILPNTPAHPPKVG